MAILLGALAAAPVTTVDRVNRAWTPLLLDFLSAAALARGVTGAGSVGDDADVAEDADAGVEGAPEERGGRVSGRGKAWRGVVKGWLEVLVRLKDAGNYHRCDTYLPQMRQLAGPC
jgi:hypothetical protein